MEAHTAAAVIKTVLVIVFATVVAVVVVQSERTGVLSDTYEATLRTWPSSVLAAGLMAIVVCTFGRPGVGGRVPGPYNVPWLLWALVTASALHLHESYAADWRGQQLGMRDWMCVEVAQVPARGCFLGLDEVFVVGAIGEWALALVGALAAGRWPLLSALPVAASAWASFAPVAAAVALGEYVPGCAWCAVVMLPLSVWTLLELGKQQCVTGGQVRAALVAGIIHHAVLAHGQLSIASNASAEGRAAGRAVMLAVPVALVALAWLGDVWQGLRGRPLRRQGRRSVEIGSKSRGARGAPPSLTQPSEPAASGTGASHRRAFAGRAAVKGRARARPRVREL